jgi:8-oxo-dGTP diphosphatase
MKLLSIIKEQDIFSDRGVFSEPNYNKNRKAVRIILQNERGYIALSYYPKKENFSEEYSLPGGGVEEGENIIDALKREALEETGCEITTINEIGEIIEYGISPNLKQETYVFSANIYKILTRHLTDKEKDNSLELVWVSVEDALSLITKQESGFSRERSLVSLKSWIYTQNGFSKK